MVIPADKGMWGGIKGYGGFSGIQGTPEDQARALRACIDDGTLSTKGHPKICRLDKSYVHINMSVHIKVL